MGMAVCGATAPRRWYARGWEAPAWTGGLLQGLPLGTPRAVRLQPIGGRGGACNATPAPRAAYRVARRAE